MKKLGILLLASLMVVGVLPSAAFAAESTTNNLDLTNYLNEVSTTRGFDVSKEDIDLSLADYGMTTDDFNTVDEIKNYLGEVINADLINLNSIYENYELDQTTLPQLLNEYGEELNDYVFLNNLDYALDLYTYNFEREVDFDTKLAAYLADISTVRGFDVTEEYINSYLSEYSTSIDDFETASDLSEYLGDVIKADLSNLDYLYTNFGMDEQALLQLIEENGKIINDYVYIDQLEALIWSSLGGNYPTMDPAMIMDIVKQLGLTEEEIQNLEAHFLSITDYLSSAEGQAQLEQVVNRMMELSGTLIEKGTADENYKLPDAEIAEFASIYEELLTIVKLNIVFSLSIDGVDTPYSVEELMKMNKTDIKDTDIKITLYNDNSELLADLVVTSEFLNSELGGIIEEVDDAVNIENDSVQTVKGGQLPKTASNYIPNALIGLLITIVGILIYRKVRNDKDEILEKKA